MTPQSEGRYATSLLFTPRSADGRGSGADYRLPKTGANATRSPSPEQGRQHREGSFFREGSVGMGSVQGGGRAFGREGSSYREGSAQPDTPVAGRRGGAVGERSRFGPAPPDTAARGTPPTLGRGYSPGLATSRGRRRSTTPQPVPHEAPPPPPTDSLFCNPAAVGAAWAAATTAEPNDAAEGDGEQPQEPEPPSNDNSDQWVIVYGFKAGDVELLLREFGKCGDIAQHGAFGAPASANWLYLQFQDKWAAQRALYRDGEQLSRSLMIGVRPLDELHRAAIRQHLDADPSSQRSLAPKPALARRYMIGAPQQQQGGAARSVPPPSQSMWAKVNEFVFGL